VSDLASLIAERAHLELARRCLDSMVTSASAIADYGVDELASQSLGRIRTERLRALTADPDAPPFFGRTDRDTEDFHIGRRHVRDPAGDPVVIDWRAPIARAFYRATPADRMGVRLRRRFGFHAGVLKRIARRALHAKKSYAESSRKCSPWRRSASMMTSSLWAGTRSWPRE